MTPRNPVAPSQPKPAELRRDPPVCVHCDTDLSCGACGMEQPYDDISLLKARIQELESLTKLQGQEISITRERDGALEGALREARRFIDPAGDPTALTASAMRDRIDAALEAKPAGGVGNG